MKKRTEKAFRDADQKASPIEKYNSNVDRRTSQNGPLVFSAFVAVAVFLLVMAAGFALAGDFTVGGLAVAFLVAWAATMSAHIAMQWEKIVVFRFGRFSRVKGPDRKSVV